MSKTVPGRNAKTRTRSAPKASTKRATSLLILVPIAIVFTAIALMRWHYNRPPPYANPALSSAVALRTIEANFPDGDTFIMVLTNQDIRDIGYGGGA